MLSFISKYQLHAVRRGGGGGVTVRVISLFVCAVNNEYDLEELRL